jgi:hypothetical protein
MAGPREDSVLVNLRALRGLEEERVREEQRELERRAEQARRALEEAERLRREQAERMIREAEEARRLEAARREREAREDELRLEEAERRARVEAEAALEEKRLRFEVWARVHAKRPRGLYAAVVALVLGAGAIGVWALVEHGRVERANTELAASRAEMERNRAAADDLRRQIDDYMKRPAPHAPVVDATATPVPTGTPPATRPRPHGGGATKPPAVTQPACIKMCPAGKPICAEEEKVCAGGK